MNQYRSYQPKCCCVSGHLRAGYTLFELSVSIAAGSMLLMGMTSALYLASRAVDPPLAVKAAQDAADLLYELTDELQHAIYIGERSATAVQFVVPDITGDGQADVVRYEWSGSPGAPLQRTLNFGSPSTVARQVHEFRLTYSDRTMDESFDSGLVESSERTLSELESGSGTDQISIRSTAWPGQCVSAISLPPEARFWRPTKVQLQLSADALPLGVFSLQLRPATGSGTPTSDVLSQVNIAELSLGFNFAWREYTMHNMPRLTPAQKVCIVLQPISTSSTGLAVYQSSGVTLPAHGLLVSTDQGATWQLTSWQGLRFRLKGTYFSPSGVTHTVSRRYATGVRATLRLGETEDARVHSQVPLLNTPELLDGYWCADFDRDPRELDENFDGTPDWSEVDASSELQVSSLVKGIWQANPLDLTSLRTQPDHDFTALTTVELRSRCTAFQADGYGAQAVFHVDRSGTTYGAVFTSVRREIDGTQTARVYTRPTPTTEAIIAESTNLSTDFVDMRLVIDPAADLVAVWVNGIYRATGTYTPISGNSDRFCTVQCSGSDAEFDYISIRVSADN